MISILFYFFVLKNNKLTRMFYTNIELIAYDLKNIIYLDRWNGVVSKLFALFMTVRHNERITLE